MDSIRRLEPVKVTDHTWAIQHYQEGDPVGINVNSLVIKAKEPVIVDTGAPALRGAWLQDAWDIVDPADVRWIFLSHDDPDHTGALEAALEACPNATLVTNWFSVERHRSVSALPLERMRWVEHGGSFDAGDRTFVAIRPPLFDGPTTRGLYDSRTGLYWASDCFASPVPGPTVSAADLDREFWTKALVTAGTWLSPWHAMLDQRKYNRAVDEIASLDIRTIATAHGPTIPAGLVDDAIEVIRSLPSVDPVPWPGQVDLDAMLGNALGGAA